MTEQTIPTADEIVSRIEDAIAADRPRRDLRMTDSIREDLRLDSLALMEVLTRVEEQFDIELIDTAEIYSVVTVGELVQVIRSTLAAKP